VYVYNFLKCNEGKVKNTEHIYLIYWNEIFNEISYLYLKRNIRFFFILKVFFIKIRTIRFVWVLLFNVYLIIYVL